MQRNDVIDLFITLIAIFGGWKFVKYILNLNSNQRITAAYAFKEEYVAVIEDYKRVQKEVDEAKKEIMSLNNKVDALYKQVHQLEDAKLSLVMENNELRLQLKEARHNVCMRPDSDCNRRFPKRGYCALPKEVIQDSDSNTNGNDEHINTGDKEEE